MQNFVSRFVGQNGVSKAVRNFLRNSGWNIREDNPGPTIAGGALALLDSNGNSFAVNGGSLQLVGSTDQLIPTGAVDILNFGAIAGDAGQALANRQAFIKACQGNRAVRVPAGDYYVSNNAGDDSQHFGAVYLYQFTGQLIFEAGARVVFTNNAQGGFWFYNAHGMRVTGMRVGFQTPTTARTSPYEAIKVDHSDYVTFRDTRVEDSVAAGLLFYLCDHPAAFNTNIDKAQADGLHFANCSNFTAIGGTIRNCGDDALVCVNYSTVEDRNGGEMDNFRIFNCARYGARNNGVSDVLWSNILVDGCVKSGMTIHFDESSLDGDPTRRPKNVVVTNSVFKNCGTGASGLGSGIYIYGADACKVSNCRIENAYSYGVHVDKTAVNGSTGNPFGTGVTEVSLENISVVGVTEANNGCAFRLSSCDRLFMTNCYGVNCQSYGLYATGVFMLAFSNLALEDVNKGLKAADAGSFMRVEGCSIVNGNGLTIYDSQSAATGYKFSEQNSNTSPLPTTTQGFVTGLQIYLKGTGAFVSNISSSSATFKLGLTVQNSNLISLSSIAQLAGNAFRWDGRSQMRSDSDGNVRMATNGGTAFNSLEFGSAGARGIYIGAGVPSITTGAGSIYLRTDGGTLTTLYVREGSVWVAK